MAKAIGFVHRPSAQKKRPGIHAKTKTSKLKGSKNYVKAYRSQGK